MFKITEPKEQLKKGDIIKQVINWGEKFKVKGKPLKTEVNYKEVVCKTPKGVKIKDLKTGIKGVLKAQNMTGIITNYYLYQESRD